LLKDPGHIFVVRHNLCDQLVPEIFDAPYFTLFTPAPYGPWWVERNIELVGDPLEDLVHGDAVRPKEQVELLIVVVLPHPSGDLLKLSALQKVQHLKHIRILGSLKLNHFS